MAPIHHHFEMKAVVRDEDHGALLDRHRDPLRRGLRALLQVLPADQAGLVADEGARLRRSRRSGAGGSRAARASAATRSCRRPDARERGRPRSLLDGVDVVVKSPGVPARRAARAGGAGARRAGLVGGRARLAPARCRGHALRRRHRHERQDDDVRAARRDLPRRRARRGRRGEHRPPAHVACARPSGSSASCRSFQLEDVHDARLRRCGAAQPRARPPRPPRQLRGLPRRRSCGSSSARGRRSCRAGSGLAGIPFAADDPLPAEPLIRGAHNRENAAAATAAARGGRDRGRRRSPRPCGRSRACRTGSRGSARSTASPTSTTRRRRTSRPRCARSPRTRTSRCT